MTRYESWKALTCNRDSALMAADYPQRPDFLQSVFKTSGTAWMPDYAAVRMGCRNPGLEHRWTSRMTSPRQPDAPITTVSA